MYYVYMHVCVCVCVFVCVCVCVCVFMYVGEGGRDTRKIVLPGRKITAVGKSWQKVQAARSNPLNTYIHTYI
jgi:hypothetical protein